jgi:WD40 repeat protein
VEASPATEEIARKVRAAIRFIEPVSARAPLRFRVWAGIAGALLLLSASPAGATVPGVNGDLAYETAMRPGIAVVDALGERRTPTVLAHIGGSPREPAWSPNATRLAFTATRAGNQDIYVAARDGTDERRLTSDPAPDSGAAWSPDGGSIAFESTRDGNADIYVMGADGTTPRRLTSAPSADQHPTWSPDGRRIAFESDRDGNVELYVMAADGSDQRRVTFGPLPDRDPSWSPDGREIAFVAYGPTRIDPLTPHTEIYTVSPDSGRTRQLTNIPVTNESPAWSPDGRQIVFSSDRGGESSLYVIDPHGRPTPQRSLRPLNVRGRNADWAQLPRPAGAPTRRRTANATPIGKVLVKPPGARAFAPLTSPREIPLGTELDTRAGKVNLTTADPDGRTSTTTASKGTFTLTQTSASTDLTMSNPKCPFRASRAARVPPPDRSTLNTKVRSTGHQQVRVHGRHTIAAARGTAWTTTVTCSKTTVKVAEGTVIVSNRLTRAKGRRGGFQVKGKYSVGSEFG